MIMGERRSSPAVISKPSCHRVFRLHYPLGATSAVTAGKLLLGNDALGRSCRTQVIQAHLSYGLAAIPGGFCFCANAQCRLASVGADSACGLN
jgi:hypothetical protein